jgi:hypothetical protein
MNQVSITGSIRLKENGQDAQGSPHETNDHTPIHDASPNQIQSFDNGHQSSHSQSHRPAGDQLLLCGMNQSNGIEWCQ